MQTTQNSGSGSGGPPRTGYNIRSNRVANHVYYQQARLGSAQPGRDVVRYEASSRTTETDPSSTQGGTRYLRGRRTYIRTPQNVAEAITCSRGGNAGYAPSRRPRPSVPSPRVVTVPSARLIHGRSVQGVEVVELFPLRESSRFGQVNDVDASLPSDLLQRLPTRRHGRKSDDPALTDESKACPICRAEYGEEDQLRLLPCLHSFHKDCVDTWLQRNACCPCCRSDTAYGILQAERQSTPVLSRQDSSGRHAERLAEGTTDNALPAESAHSRAQPIHQGWGAAVSGHPQRRTSRRAATHRDVAASDPVPSYTTSAAHRGMASLPVGDTLQRARGAAGSAGRIVLTSRSLRSGAAVPAWTHSRDTSRPRGTPQSVRGVRTSPLADFIPSDESAFYRFMQEAAPIESGASDERGRGLMMLEPDCDNISRDMTGSTTDDHVTVLNRLRTFMLPGVANRGRLCRGEGCLDVLKGMLAWVENCVVGSAAGSMQSLIAATGRQNNDCSEAEVAVVVDRSTVVTPDHAAPESLYSVVNASGSGDGEACVDGTSGAIGGACEPHRGGDEGDSMAEAPGKIGSWTSRPTTATTAGSAGVSPRD